MTGLDCLREEMEKRGLNKSQIESKVAAVVLDILSNSGDKYTNMWTEEQEASEKMRKIREDARQYSDAVNYNIRQLARLEIEINEAEKRKKEYGEYIEKFYKSLEDCETAEGRDAMRIAQMFINSVDIDTKYDNTAYIIGLASILSNGKINAISELKKINKKLPTAYYGSDIPTF